MELKKANRGPDLLLKKLKTKNENNKQQKNNVVS